jgi:diguanylate cyclase (GGDEF)-like protein
VRGFPVRRDDGTVYRIVGVFEDVTERKEAEIQLAHQAYYDPLTQLPNRHFFTERLAQALAGRDEQAGRIALFFLDLDRFKVINDSLGHELGDRLLTIVAERLRVAMRPGDLIARLGGDEFTILLEGLHSLEEALAVARRCIAMIQRPVLLAGREVVVTPSIGIVFNPGARTTTDLMRDADVALYQAKGQGRGRFVLFDQAMNARALARLDLEADLRRALHAGEFALVYQPILALPARRIVGVEALIRWHHPARGMISPLDFIPIAEEIGLIVPLGRWVLTEACRQLREWQRTNPAAADLTLSVNLSAREFRQPDSVEVIAAILAESGLAPERLQLEITESVLMDDARATILALESLNALNVRLAIDDFGTGYSSLAYLKRFPLDTLKIDRLFIDKLDSDGEDAAIVRAIVTLAHTLGLTVVAEGIEREAQIPFLVALGCEEGQGYYFARPLPPAALDALLAEQLAAAAGPSHGRE